jgi:magnesium-transporting ATPase (P-type)
MKKNNWYQMNIEDVIEVLNSSLSGLSNEEAEKRIIETGLNTLPKSKKNTILRVFFKQFINPIIIILLIAAIFSFLIGESIDTIFILIIIALDGILGTFQEWRAEQSAASLQNMMKIKAVVIRDGIEKLIDSEQLVIGDIVRLESGNKVSADLRIIESHNLTIDEAFLTGESLAASKNNTTFVVDTKVPDRLNMCFAGSTVTSGRGLGIVVETGVNTEIGKIASDVILTKKTKTPLVVRMEKFTQQICYFLALVALVLVIILYYKGYAPKEIFFFVVALSISAIPEGLPVVLTVVLSIATKRMSKKGVIVRQLNAVESLGSCTVIASDKTGTLTLNEQTAKVIELPDGSGYKVSGQGYNGNGELIGDNVASNYKDSITQLQELNKLIYINNEAHLVRINDEWVSHGDAMDIALLALSHKIGYINHDIKKQVIASIPYESENKYSAVFYKEDDCVEVTIKGSVETVLDHCESINTSNGIEVINKDDILKRNDDLAKQGYRVLAVARGKCENFDINKKELPNMVLIGLIGFIDPIRSDALYAIKKCGDAGIKVVMITGDHPLTAAVIAKELGIIKNNGQVANGDDIDKYLQLEESEFDDFVKKTRVFARVTPNQKLAIVESFKRQGEFIAVTGDGVNDAPAIKSANIGIAMGSGTDVAKETSSMIITNDNFSSIVDGIEEGRYAYSNIRKVIYLLISCGFAEVLLFVFAILLNTPMPLVAVQLLWLNLITNGIQDVALAFEGGEKEVMGEKPRKPNETIFNKLLIQETIISGLTISILVFCFWYILLNVMKMEVNHARSYILLIMVFMQNIHVFNCRSETKSAFKVPFKNNKFIVLGVVITLLIQSLVSQTTIMSDILGIYPISIQNTLFAISFTLPLLLVMEVFKYIKRK